MNNDSCLISKVKCKETSRPIILNFENGVLNEGQESRLVSGLYKRKHSSLLAAATKSMVYTGEVTRNEMYNSFIGLIDKKTNKATLIALDQARMSPWFKEDKSLDISIEDKASSVGNLNKTFGSKKVKRQTEQREKMQLDISHVKEQLEQTVADIQVEVKDMVAPSIESFENDDYKPKINRAATRVEDVYVLHELISLEILQSLSEEVERMFIDNANPWGTTDFVTQQLKKLERLESGDTEKMCQLFLYVDCLIKFMVIPAKTIANKKYIACTYSEIVHTDILKKFTVVTGNARSRPNIMRDKCLCYILVLSIIACKNTLNLEYFSKELKLGIKKLQDVSRVLGLTVSKETVQLKLPLPPPVTSLTRSKKKKL